MNARRRAVVSRCAARVAALVLLGCCATPAQQEARSQPPPKAAQSAPGAANAGAGPAARDDAGGAAQGAALVVLEKAARFQRGDAPRGSPATLHGRFHVGVRDEDGALIQASVERWYTRSPERLLTTRTESVTGSTSSVGWDGRVAWFRDHGSGDVVIYSDAPDTYAVDLDLLQEQIRITRLLLDASVLDALLPRLVAPAVGGPRSWTDIDGAAHASTVVTAGLPDELFGAAAGSPPPRPGDPPLRLALEFVVDDATGALWSLRVAAPHRPDLAPLTLRFDLHGLTRGGLRVPGNVRVYRGDSAREDARLGVEVLEVDGEERLAFDVDEPLDPALFAPPAKR